MRIRKHEAAVCPRCRHESVWYGLKEEATGWKVFCVCGREEQCGHEWKAGWIPTGEIDSKDEAYRRGEGLCN